MRIDWYFDVISPFAWLQWPAIRQLAAQRAVTLKPIVFAGLLDHLGSKGPAEIPGKREFTYRHALWRARQHGQPMRFPPAHPFNPLAALRLCIAAGATPEAIDAVLGWIWREGQAGDCVEALAPVIEQLGLSPADLGRSEVKQALRSNFDDALAAGVFGVPTLVIEGERFWGEDATAMALDYLRDRSLFDEPEYRRLQALPVGVQRGLAS